MAGVVKRTANSVIADINIIINNNTDESEWHVVTVGGSVIFKWKVTLSADTNYMNYYIQFTKKNRSDKMNYIVTYTHWKSITGMGTSVMRVRTDVEAVYFIGMERRSSTKEVTVEISTDHLSPYATIYYYDAEMTDFMLRGEDGSVPFHKVVMAAHSSVFKTMLAGEWKETSEGVIDVPNTSKEMLQHLKKFMYLGKLPEKQNEQVDCIKQLLLLSSCYLIEDLTLLCIKELRFLLTPENVSNMIQFAKDNNINHLFVEILDCVAMGDIDLNGLLKHLEAEDATPLQCLGEEEKGEE